MSEEPRQPQRGPLTTRERGIVAAWSIAPIGVAMVAMSPFVLADRASFADLVAASVVYGGLVALATGFVAYDRLQARQCPACTARNPRDGVACSACGYDLARRPRYRCSENHVVTLDPGTCPCGRRLQPLPEPRGIGREVTGMLRVGGWMLVFLLAVGLVLQWLN
ncbi:hypothetical protein [Salsipaludibacter albus]|uniref:hypothetical protein n=1 Tax=Salsipaludibacter albus TaxID=2849650 RepID=UPI001EE443EA|nr:hypothetical protein [Salsipaludibacter albus]MBY5163309.1 hypothetical protein [Salsipaludibacter albus]